MFLTNKMGDQTALIKGDNFVPSPKHYFFDNSNLLSLSFSLHK